MKISWKTIKGNGPYAYLQKTVKNASGVPVSKHIAYLGKIGNKVVPMDKIAFAGETVIVPKLDAEVFDSLKGAHQEKMHPMWTISSTLNTEMLDKQQKHWSDISSPATIKKAMPKETPIHPNHVGLNQEGEQLGDSQSAKTMIAKADAKEARVTGVPLTVTQAPVVPQKMTKARGLPQYATPTELKLVAEHPDVKNAPPDQKIEVAEALVVGMKKEAPDMDAVVALRDHPEVKAVKGPERMKKALNLAYKAQIQDAVRKAQFQTPTEMAPPEPSPPKKIKTPQIPPLEGMTPLGLQDKPAPSESPEWVDTSGEKTTASALLKTYLANEDANQHTANYYLLADNFGTPDQQAKMGFYHATEAHTGDGANEWMYENINPYYYQLVKEATAEKQKGQETGGWVQFTQAEKDALQTAFANQQFSTMTGAKQHKWGANNDELLFKIGKNPENINWVRIKKAYPEGQEGGEEAWVMQGLWVTTKHPAGKLKTETHLYAVKSSPHGLSKEYLHDHFKTISGLDTGLGKDFDEAFAKAKAQKQKEFDDGGESAYMIDGEPVSPEEYEASVKKTQAWEAKPAMHTDYANPKATQLTKEEIDGLRSAYFKDLKSQGIDFSGAVTKLAGHVGQGMPIAMMEAMAMELESPAVVHDRMKYKEGIPQPLVKPLETSYGVFNRVAQAGVDWIEENPTEGESPEKNAQHLTEWIDLGAEHGHWQKATGEMVKADLIDPSDLMNQTVPLADVPSVTDIPDDHPDEAWASQTAEEIATAKNLEKAQNEVLYEATKHPDNIGWTFKEQYFPMSSVDEDWLKQKMLNAVEVEAMHINNTGLGHNEYAGYEAVSQNLIEPHLVAEENTGDTDDTTPTLGGDVSGITTTLWTDSEGTYPKSAVSVVDSETGAGASMIFDSNDNFHPNAPDVSMNLVEATMYYNKVLQSYVDSKTENYGISYLAPQKKAFEAQGIPWSSMNAQQMKAKEALPSLEKKPEPWPPKAGDTQWINADPEEVADIVDATKGKPYWSELTNMSQVSDPKPTNFVYMLDLLKDPKYSNASGGYNEGLYVGILAPEDSDGMPTIAGMSETAKGLEGALGTKGKEDFVSKNTSLNVLKMLVKQGVLYDELHNTALTPLWLKESVQKGLLPESLMGAMEDQHLIKEKVSKTPWPKTPEGYWESPVKAVIGGKVPQLYAGPAKWKEEFTTVSPYALTPEEQVNVKSNVAQAESTLADLTDKSYYTDLSTKGSYHQDADIASGMKLLAQQTYMLGKEPTDKDGFIPALWIPVSQAISQNEIAEYTYGSPTQALTQMVKEGVKWDKQNKTQLTPEWLKEGVIKGYWDKSVIQDMPLKMAGYEPSLGAYMPDKDDGYWNAISGEITPTPTPTTAIGPTTKSYVTDTEGKFFPHPELMKHGGKSFGGVKEVSGVTDTDVPEGMIKVPIMGMVSEAVTTTQEPTVHEPYGKIGEDSLTPAGYTKYAGGVTAITTARDNLSGAGAVNNPIAKHTRKQLGLLLVNPKLNDAGGISHPPDIEKLQPIDSAPAHLFVKDSGLMPDLKEALEEETKEVIDAVQPPYDAQAFKEAQESVKEENDLTEAFQQAVIDPEVQQLEEDDQHEYGEYWDNKKVAGLFNAGLSAHTGKLYPSDSHDPNTFPPLNITSRDQATALIEPAVEGHYRLQAHVNDVIQNTPLNETYSAGDRWKWYKNKKVRNSLEKVANAYLKADYANDAGVSQDHINQHIDGTENWERMTLKSEGMSDENIDLLYGALNSKGDDYNTAIANQPYLWPAEDTTLKNSYLTPSETTTTVTSEKVTGYELVPESDLEKGLTTPITTKAGIKPKVNMELVTKTPSGKKHIPDFVIKKMETSALGGKDSLESYVSDAYLLKAMKSKPSQKALEAVTVDLLEQIGKDTTGGQGQLVKEVAEKVKTVDLTKPKETKASREKFEALKKKVLQGKSKGNAVNWDSDLVYKSGSKGSNEGALYESKALQQPVYVKWNKTSLHNKNEILANRLYDLFGVPVPNVHEAKVNNKEGVLSEWITNAKPMSSEQMRVNPDVAKGFIADAWLSNWDVAGQGYDNIVAGETNSKGITPAYRIDTGGALLFRAQGNPKNVMDGSDFSESVVELGTLRDGSNTQSTAIFNTLTEDQRKEGAETLGGITDFMIDKVVDDANIPDKLPKDILDTYDSKYINRLPTNPNEFYKKRLKERRDNILQDVLGESGVAEVPDGLLKSSGFSTLSPESTDMIIKAVDEKYGLETAFINVLKKELGDEGGTKSYSALKKYYGSWKGATGNVKGNVLRVAGATANYHPDDPDLGLKEGLEELEAYLIQDSGEHVAQDTLKQVKKVMASKEGKALVDAITVSGQAHKVYFAKTLGNKDNVSVNEQPLVRAKRGWHAGQAKHELKKIMESDPDFKGDVNNLSERPSVGDFVIYDKNPSAHSWSITSPFKNSQGWVGYVPYDSVFITDRFTNIGAGLTNEDEIIFCCPAVQMKIEHDSGQVLKSQW